MAKSAILSIKVIADTLAAKTGLKDIGKSAGGVEDSFGKMALPAAAALGAITLFGAEAVGAASDVEQSFGGLEAVYKDQGDAAKQLARDASAANGLSSAEYAQMATTLGAALKNMGVSSDALLGQTDDLIDLGADLSAQFGGSTSDAVSALSSLLRGERDPIERYGVSIKQATIDAALAAQGLSDLTGPAKTAAEAQAVLGILTQQTADAQGAFARETDTAAHAQQVANAEWTNAQAALGEALLPAVTSVTTALAGLAHWVVENKQLVLILVGVVGGFAAAILAVNAALSAMRAVTALVAAAQWLLNSALFANPIGLVVVAIAALVAAFILAYKNSETFRRIVDGVFQAVVGIVRTAVAAIRGVFDTLTAILRGPWETMQRVVATVVAAVKAAIAGLARFVKPVLDGIKAGIKFIRDGIAAVKSAIDKLPDLPKMPWDNGKSGKAAPAPATSAAPRVGGLRAGDGRAMTGGGASSVTLVLDREVFGRAVISGLRRYDRRNGPAQVLPRWS